MRAELPSDTVTFLFTDIEGSTKLLHELGPERYAEALTEHRRIIRAAIARHAGVEVDTQGDAFFVAFASAPEAVAAAVETQRTLAGGPVRVRMGLHTGRPHLTAEGYVGADVHRGARIAVAGHGGQILLSKETRDLIEVEVTDLGEHRLKDFDQPVPIFQIGMERFPPLKTISNTNLPRPASSFIGRERELREVGALLADGHRLITLTGPGGSGKTRLAIEAAAEALPDFKAGAFWVGLAAIADPALVSGAIATTLGAAEGLAGHIGERQMLLVIDNFEQVIEAAGELSPLLEACPNLKLVVTSRQILRLNGEREYPVPPLEAQEAIDLFLARSGLEEAQPEIAELCRRLDNLPLAVELAAARARMLSPAQIVERLSGRLDALKGGRDADPRQRTLRATIDWSHSLLDQDEQRLFARLASFAGGCTLEAAEQVVAADLDTLESLVDKSLVRRSGDRFWMLETIREFAAERLDAAPDAEDVRRRHAGYFTSVAEEHDGMAGPAAHALQERLEAEQPNVRAALEWACNGGDPGIALRLTGSLWRLWWILGSVREGAMWCQRALALGSGQPEDLLARAEHCEANMAMAGGDPARAIEILPRCLEAFRRAKDSLRIGRTLMDLGIATYLTGDAAASTGYLADALAWADQTEDRYLAGSAAINLGNAAMADGRLDEASELLERAVSDAGSLGEATMVRTALQTLAVIDLRRGDLEQAAARLAESIEMSRRGHDWRGMGHELATAAAVLAARDPAAAFPPLAALAELVDNLGFVLEPLERSQHEEAVEAARAKLGDEAFETSMREARALDQEELLDRVVAALTLAAGGGPSEPMS